ncbi:MAG: site-2 protease family protein [Planctomycetaceae bacterium]|jgi:membrane-associated protease RseP (regulator of RpoE activity)|nr:site-2 protease family protein [Planctomycetaceae bacterium]
MRSNDSYNSRIYWQLPLLLYVVTWLTTTGFRFDFEDGGFIYQFFLSLMLNPFDGDLSVEVWQNFRQKFYQGILFSVPLMLILTCHELGHFIQMKRYGVRSSLPYFIPMPVGPFGTLGAVIAMDGRIPNARALFDIGISGPLAGLIPTLFCLYYGIKWSYFVPVSLSGEMTFGNSLLFQYMTYWIFGTTPVDVILSLHPVGLAGWVGLFLTSLNLMPFGQLDGGHVFYALLGRRAINISWGFFYTVILLVIWFRLWHWSLILILLAWIGITHPPTANENVKLTPFRRILGWGILAFIILGFTPTPITINDPPQNIDPPRIYCFHAECQVETDFILCEL